MNDYWVEVARDPTNNSKSKQLWSFGKGDRFMILPPERHMQ